MTSLPSHQDVASIAGNVLRRQSNIHFGKMRMWMPLVPRSFPPKDCLGDLQALKRRFSRSHVRLLVLVVTKSGTCKATNASFQRLEQVRNRQQLLCGIHLRHVGRFDFAAGILNHKLYALQERKPWNLTKPSNGANENKVFLGMAGKWDARIFCPWF